MKMIIRKEQPTKLDLLHDREFCEAKERIKKEFLSNGNRTSYEMHYEVNAKTGETYWYVEVGY